MKIALITDGIPLSFANSINTMKHAHAFYNLGHHVEILVIQRFNEEINKFKVSDIYDFYGIDRKIKIKYFRDYTPCYINKDLRFIGPFFEMITKFINKINKKLISHLEAEKRISRYIKKSSFDLSYCRRAEKVAYYNILNKIPTVIESHNINLFNFIPDEFKELIKLRNNFFFKGIITINEILENQFKKYGIEKKKILIREDAVDLESFNSIVSNKCIIRKKLNIPLNKKVILYTGNLNKGRGIEIIIQAAENFKKKKIAFYIIGGKRKKIRYWKKYIRKKKLDLDLSFLGFKHNSMIPRYLKSADILLAPYSLSCETVDWMSPLKIFEYMAAKVPIIASNVKRLIEICDNNECIFFNVDDPIDLSEKIILLSESEVLQKELIRNASKKVRDYTYKNRCIEILNLL